MATIIANGCWDVFHAGHSIFLTEAKNLGVRIFKEGTTIPYRGQYNRLIVAVNSDVSARRLKWSKWGNKYPIDSLETRMANVSRIADEVIGFDSEEDLRSIIGMYTPCILVKGPDYAGKSVTGDDIAPVIILDTPEPESVKEMKKKVYGR